MTVSFPNSMSADVVTNQQQSAPVPDCASKTAIARSPVLRLRGLPFLATTLDVKEFFSGFDLSDVYICRRNGGCFISSAGSESLYCRTTVFSEHLMNQSVCV
jgi:hypothetical protein